MASNVGGVEARYGSQAPASEAVSGPGTELALLLSAAGVESAALRGGRAQQMDRWGTDGCRRRRNEILRWLRDEHRQRGWAERTAAGARMAACVRDTLRGVLEIFGDPFYALVEAALIRADERVAPPVSRVKLAAQVATPFATHRLDHHNLAPGIDGLRFNASIVQFRDRTLLAWRNRSHNSRVYLTELDRTLAPTGNTQLLDLEHHFARSGQDDPRLFVFDGRLHVSFTGVHELEVEDTTTSHMLYAELDDSFAARQVFMLDYRYRADWEKNWTFFECDGVRYIVYSVRPHRVLAVTGGVAVAAHEMPWSTPWQGGVHRGGSSPVRVGDEFYCFFHGVCYVDGVRTHTAGVYTFEAKPPFRVTRCTRWPILIPDPATRPPGKENVVYPCGAFLDGERWILSCGVHDSWIEISQFDAADIDKRLEVIA